MMNTDKTNGRRSARAIARFRKSEIDRLLAGGVSLSKAAKILGISYKLAKVYASN